MRSGSSGVGPELISYIFGMTGTTVYVLILKTNFAYLQKYDSLT